MPRKLARRNPIFYLDKVCLYAFFGSTTLYMSTLGIDVGWTGWIVGTTFEDLFTACLNFRDGSGGTKNIRMYPPFRKPTLLIEVHRKGKEP